MSNFKILSGVDIVENKRIEKMLNKSKEVINDIFSENEIDYCLKKKYSIQSLAARFAVKEALLKATDSHILRYDLRKIETINLASGKPIINLSETEIIDKIKSLLLKDKFLINVSISHEKEYSVAQVIIY